MWCVYWYTGGASARPSPWLDAGGLGLRVAQLVLMARLPIHCPFMDVIALSAS